MLAARLVAVAAVVLLASACDGGGGVPENGVAKVGDRVISRSTFHSWYRATSLGQRHGGDRVVPDPPDFRRCVAARRKLSQLRIAGLVSPEKPAHQCRQEYHQLKREVMRFLIFSEWVQHEAVARGIALRPADVRRSFSNQKRRAFTSDSAYEDFLKTRGVTEQHVLYRVKLDILQRRLAEAIRTNAPTVSRESVRAYYRRHRDRFFGQPFTKVEPAIESMLQSERQQKALDEFTRQLRDHWRKETVCQEDFVVSFCRNGPGA